MSTLGFDSIGKLGLGELPQPDQPIAVGTQWTSPVRKAGLSVAVIATTFVGFVPPPAPAKPVFASFSQPLRKPIKQAPWNFCIPAPKQATAVFSAFSQPQPRKARVEGRTLYEPQPPAGPPFTGFAKFDNFLPKPKTTFLYSAFQPAQLLVPSLDTHDGVFVKKKRRGKQYDSAEDEFEIRRKRREAIYDALQGPPVTYTLPDLVLPPRAEPPNVEELAKTMMAAQIQAKEAQRLAELQADDDDLEQILKDIL